MSIDADELVRDFLKVATMAGVALQRGDVEHEPLPAPHKPGALPLSKQAAYVFCIGSECLKVDKCGPKSKAKFMGQHYDPHNSGSNLSKSLLADLQRGRSEEPGDWRRRLVGVDASTVGAWVRQNTSRYNFYLDNKQPRWVLSLLEAFLQCRLKPAYED